MCREVVVVATCFNGQSIAAKLRVGDFIVQEQFLALALLYAFLVKCSVDLS